ncbi:hypothetical protein [Streptomyces hydrogenans]|uniref:hypothetical protein n=1 Tax=Streptomyces hydrogenans TaxID=1873719 RepID=UPI0037F5C1A6
MTQPSRCEIQHAVVSQALTAWGIHPLIAEGLTDRILIDLDNAAAVDEHTCPNRAAVLREAAEVFRADATETARAARASYDPDMARAAKQLAAVAARLDRMAEEGR